MTIQITVRDGRIGRDPSLVEDAGGEVLAEFEAERPYGQEDIGGLLTLPDGSQWPIIGFNERLNDQSWHQTLFIGDA